MRTNIQIGEPVDCTPRSAGEPEGDPLVTLTMREVARFFRERTSHSPSQEMMKALEGIPRVVSSIISGTAPARYHLCSLDTGVGKSVTLAETIRQVRKVHPDMGMVVCVGRYTQIEAMRDAIGLGEDEYAVLVSQNREDLRNLGLGVDRLQEAPVLLTTHSQVETRLRSLAAGCSAQTVYRIRSNTTYPHSGSSKPLYADTHPKSDKPHPLGPSGLGSMRDVEGRSCDEEAREGTAIGSETRLWQDTPVFFYKGKPRPLRVWDEAILPGTPLTVTRKALYGLLGVLPPRLEVTAMIDELLAEMRSYESGELVLVPDLADATDLHTLGGSLTEPDRERHHETISALWTMSGRYARLRTDGPKAGNTLLSFKQTFPPDIKPILVLDASARVRRTYVQQERNTKDVVFLPSVKKRYDKVNIYVSLEGGGRSTYRRKYHKTLEKVAELINAHPGRRVLVLHHKQDPGKTGIGDTESNLNQLLVCANKDGRVQYCHWGVHDGTNAFVECDMVVVTSIFHHPMSLYEARARAATGTAPERDLDEEEVVETKRGELMHDLLQGLSRGSLRQCDGVQAKPCDVYVMTSRNTGIKSCLLELFPGATLNTGWHEPKEAHLTVTARQKQILDYINGRDRVEWPEIYKALGIQRANFRKLTISSEPFMAALNKMDMYVDHGKPMAFSAWLFDVVEGGFSIED